MNFVFGQSKGILWGKVSKVIKPFSWSFCLQNGFINRSYAEYLRVRNGQESSIIDHFPPEADVEPSVGVEIALYLEIHQAPSLDTLIHTVFLAMVINYVNQGYMGGWVILTTKNTVMNSLNIQIAEVVLKREHVFLLTDSVETGDDQAMVINT
jgi:hypothetical protein